MFRLDHKIALVTGAGSGIGAAIAQAFAAQGATIIVADIQPDAAEQVAATLRSQDHHAEAIALDVADEAQVMATFAGVQTRHGRLDVVVNNAGISHVGTILETSVDDWERVMRVNARGVFLCAREAVRAMLTQQPTGGSIINMASVAAQIAVERRLPYGASKGAVLAMTRSIASDFATTGIRCNALCPGTVHTPFVDGYLARSFAGHEDDERAKLNARQPTGRMGEPNEIAAAAVYFASDEAAFVTGSVLVIDGGWTARRSPQVHFMLDHLGTPPIRHQQLPPWRDDLARLAQLPNVWCKVSGLLTEADPHQMRVADIAPDIAHSLAVFGPERTLFGGDWPMLRLATLYQQWVRLLVDAHSLPFRGCMERRRGTEERRHFTLIFSLATK